MNPIDQFRQAFFDKVIREETAKEQQQKRIQRNCFHRYVAETYQRKTCSKCGHSVIMYGCVKIGIQN
jgi:hypothetical protein